MSPFRLTDEQAFAARTGARIHLLSVGLGLVSIVLALAVPIEWIWTAGVVYLFQAPIHWRNGVLIERARAKAFRHRKIHIEQTTSGSTSPMP